MRYRLTKSDVNKIVKTGYLEEVTEFAQDKLVYALQVTHADSLTVSHVNNKISLFIPQKMVSELANTDTVGFENEDGNLHLLIEKDFTCLDNVAEDQSDNYPNPLAEKLK